MLNELTNRRWGRLLSALLVAGFVVPWLLVSFYIATADALSHQSEQPCKGKVVDQNGVPVTRKPVIKAKPNPKVTEEAVKNKTKGEVLLKLVLGADRQVTDVEVIQGLPNGLTEAAVAAARQIKFEPALKDGCPVSRELKVVYQFPPK